jgi:alpha-glucosidase (family GH31 glycosyl hydrolase)
MLALLAWGAAVALASPGDARAVQDEFTYLLGDDLLVAPVVAPGARERRLFLPDGEWVDWWEGQRFRGRAVVTVAAPLNRIPLFVRAGAIIPLADGSGRLTRNRRPDQPLDPLLLKVYEPSEPTSGSQVTLFDGRRVRIRLTPGRPVEAEVTGGSSERPLHLVLVRAPSPREAGVGATGLEGGDAP